MATKTFARLLLASAISTLCVATVHATAFTGTLYYTVYSGGQNVWDIQYSYDDTSHAFSLASPDNIASIAGADGIVFAPNGNLVIGGQNTGNVYELNPNTGAVINSQATGTSNYHLTLDPSGTKVYTSDFGGRLNTLTFPIGSGSAPTYISGGDFGLTQIAFGNSGSVFYVNGTPNGYGNLGLVNLATGASTRLYTGVKAAHGLIFDPFTDLITLFGAGNTGTMNATNGSGLKLSGDIFNVDDFDQGALDGQGHALIAGGNSITFVDYSLSHDITHPDYTTSIGGFINIDDVAPLIGAGSNPNPTGIPEPATLALLGLGFAGLHWSIRRKA